MTVAHATVAELEDWLGAGRTVEEPERLLLRASELVDEHVLAAFDVVVATGLAADPIVAGGLRDAVCAQVEYWAEVGEDHDIIGLPADTSLSVGFSMSRQPPVLAQRARRILVGAGLLGGAVVSL